jgi:hypothetical protein
VQPRAHQSRPEANSWSTLVVFEHQGERYMIDGTNRLNVWLRDGDEERHDAIIIKRKMGG